MDNDIISHIKQIQEASRQNRLVIFVGTGVSASAGVPTWKDLVEEMRKEMPENVIKEETDFLKIAQLYKEQRGEKEYLERIQEILKIKTVAPTYIHDKLIKLNPCHIITTNYDNLLEQAALQNNENFHVVRRDEDVPYNHGERMLIKMHGDFDSRRIVLTENDYYDYQLNYPLIRSFIISLFASKLILFVGFSFNDINIKYILRWVEQTLHGHMQRVYWLADRPLTNLEAIYYTNKNIQTIYINPETFQKQKKVFKDERSENLYRRLALLSEDYRENHNSVISLALDYFPKYTDQLVVFGKSFRNFLPHEERKNLFYWSMGMIELPEKYLKTFKQEIQHIDLKKKHYGSYTKDQIEYLLSLLNLNGIHKIDSVDLRSVQIPLIPKESNPLLNYFNCDYEKLENSIDLLKSQHLTYTRKDMVLPYCLYLCGKYEEAYLRYSELAKEMLTHKRYILYFICIYNIASILQTLLNSRNSTLLSRNEIWDMLGEIRIEQTLNSLPLEEDIKQSLKENTFINTYSDYFKSIDLKEKLAHQRKQSEYGGMAYNSNIGTLLYDFQRLFNMGVENCIIQDHDIYCNKFYYNVAEGIIDSLLTIDKDGHSQSRLVSLDPNCIYPLIFVMHNKDICDIFNAHEAREIQAEDGFKHRLQEISENISKYFKKNHHNNVVKKEISANIIKNIILLCNFLENPPLLKDIYSSIYYLWEEGEFNEWTGYLGVFLEIQKPNADEAINILEKMVIGEPRLGVSNSYQKYIADVARIASESGKRLSKKIDLQTQDATILASLLLVVPEDIKNDIINKIIEKQDLVEIIAAEYNTRAKFLTADMIKSYDIIIPKAQEQWVEEYTCSRLYELSKVADYYPLKGAIDVFKQKHPCYCFYENPLKFNDKLAIKATWLFYCSDKDVKELLRNDDVMKKVKEYCETHKWNERFKKRIWDLL